MSSGDRFPFALAKQLARVADEAILGVTLSCIAAAVHSLVNFIRCSSALKKIRDAPSVDASALRSLLLQRNDGFSGGEEVLVVVRGTVSALKGNWIKSVAAELTQSVADKFVEVAEEEGSIKSAVKRRIELDMDFEGSLDKFMKGHWIKWVFKESWLHPSVEGLISSSSGEHGVVLQKTRSCIYNGIFSFYQKYIGIFKAKDGRQEHSNTRAVPFALKQGVQQSESDYLVVNVGKSKHPLPLETVNRHIQPITAPYNFLLALFRRDVVGVLEEEKMLFPGEEITAVGVCSLKDNGCSRDEVLQRSSLFSVRNRSEMSKDEMITVMTGDVKARMWFSIVVGFVSIALLGYAMARWKKRRLQRAKEKKKWKRAMRKREKALEREKGEARVEELCVVCLTTRRQSAFVPCGHLLCCRSCAALVKGKRNPQCPICNLSNIWEEAWEVEVVVEQGDEDEAHEDQLCVVCLTRRRESAFVPCGHLVCCRTCAVLIVRKMNPKCPICRQLLLSSVRIYAS